MPFYIQDRKKHTSMSFLPQGINMYIQVTHINKKRKKMLFIANPYKLFPKM